MLTVSGRFGRILFQADSAIVLLLASFGDILALSSVPKRALHVVSKPPNVVVCSFTFGLMIARGEEERSSRGALRCCRVAAGCAAFFFAQPVVDGPGFFTF